MKPCNNHSKNHHDLYEYVYINPIDFSIHINHQTIYYLGKSQYFTKLKLGDVSQFPHL